MAQAIDADRIRTLRFLDVPLPEIRAILAGDPQRTRSLLEGHRQRLSEQAERQRYAITLLDSMLREDPPMTYEVHLRETMPQPAAAIRGRAAWAEPGPFISGALMEVARMSGDQGVRFAGPAYAIYHSADSTEAEVDLEVGMPVAEPIDPGGRVVPSTIPGGVVATTVHRGRYEDVGPAYRAPSVSGSKNTATRLWRRPARFISSDRSRPRIRAHSTPRSPDRSSKASSIPGSADLREGRPTRPTITVARHGLPPT